MCPAAPTRKKLLVVASQLEYTQFMRICVTDIVRDEGSIVVLQGITTDGTDRVMNFACDHRPAQDIINAISQGEDVEVDVEAWQVLGTIQREGKS